MNKYVPNKIQVDFFNRIEFTSFSGSCGLSLDDYCQDLIALYMGIPYNNAMRTVIESPTFQKQADKLWAEDQRLEFIEWIAKNPLAGDVIPNADGARKVRWTVKGQGKRGGVRVIYFNLTEQGVIYLLTLYQKSDKENISPNEIKRL